jgi:hypothetical protein
MAWGKKKNRSDEGLLAFARYKQEERAKRYRAMVDTIQDWVQIPDNLHRGCPWVKVWTSRIFGFDLMMTRGKRVKVSFRKLRIKGAPYTHLDYYPSVDVALDYVTNDFSQRLLELENEKSAVEDHRELACHAIHRGRTYRPLETDPIRAPAASGRAPVHGPLVAVQRLG